ncbi:MAG TPA: diphosphomevalonate decarboxylase [Acholeplasma sp.]|nr:diphosphomevalonate decarboxylase [Acholeplasma sp.]
MKARAYVNFALIKYWGKKDEKLRLPFQASLSFTIDKLFTDTKVTVNKKLIKDKITINGISDERLNKRVIQHLNLIRSKYNIKDYVEVTSVNNVPTSAGLASSASSFAALTLAATKAFNLNLSKEELSRLSRYASGSASRSIFGNFAIWDVGDDKTSIARPIDINWPEFKIIVLMIDKSKKPASSTDAMKESVENKLLYDEWVKQSKIDLDKMLIALNNKDIKSVGEIAEKNANHMHDLIESTGITYKTKESLKAIDKIHELRTKGVLAYYTMDAGPNIKIITIDSEVNKIVDYFNEYETIVCSKGKDAHIVLN